VVHIFIFCANDILPFLRSISLNKSLIEVKSFSVFVSSKPLYAVVFGLPLNEIFFTMKPHLSGWKG